MQLARHKNTKLSGREIAVCERIRDIRFDRRCSQLEFARIAGISRERLASYERGLAPLRYNLGKEICFRFNVNQRWLAEGKQPMDDYFDISPHLEHLISPRALFSEAYDEVLKPYVEARWTSAKTWDERIYLPRLGTPSREVALFYLNKLLSRHLRVMSADLQQRYYSTVSDAAGDFFNKHIEEIEAAWEQIQKQEQSPASETLESRPVVYQEMLDNINILSQATGVQTSIRTLDELITRLRKLTKQHGAKSALAKKYKVSRQAVDQWLSRESSPSAELAFKLAQWVIEQEAK